MHDYALNIESLNGVAQSIPGFIFPKSYLKIVELEMVGFEHWFLLSTTLIQTRYKDMAKRYPSRRLIPFAARYDCDDVACFDVNGGEHVYIIHDYADEGWERRHEYTNFGEWFRVVIDELIADFNDNVFEL